MLTMEKIKKKMTELGFKDYGWDSMFRSGRSRIFGRRLANGPECECNEKVPELLVHTYFPVDKDSRMRVEFDVCGEVNGRWLKLMIYSINMDEVEEVLPGISRAMEAMWKVGYESLKLRDGKCEQDGD